MLKQACHYRRPGGTRWCRRRARCSHRLRRMYPTSVVVMKVTALSHLVMLSKPLACALWQERHITLPLVGRSRQRAAGRAAGAAGWRCRLYASRTARGRGTRCQCRLCWSAGIYVAFVDVAKALRRAAQESESRAALPATCLCVVCWQC